jgi:hypothetical protein
LSLSMWACSALQTLYGMVAYACVFICGHMFIYKHMSYRCGLCHMRINIFKQEAYAAFNLPGTWCSAYLAMNSSCFAQWRRRIGSMPRRLRLRRLRLLHLSVASVASPLLRLCLPLTLSVEKNENYTHIRTPTHTHTHTHAHAHTQARTRTHPRAQAHKHTQARTHTHTRWPLCQTLL